MALQFNILRVLILATWVLPSLSGAVTLDVHTHQPWKFYTNKKLYLFYPRDWQVAEDLYGIPIAILGTPDAVGFRSTLSLIVEPIEVPSAGTSEEDFAKERLGYFKSKSAWAEKNSAKISEPESYQSFVTPYQIKVYQYGVEYELGGVRYKDYTLLLVHGNLCHYVKILIKPGFESDYLKQIQLVNSIQFL